MDSSRGTTRLARRGEISGLIAVEELESNPIRTS